MKTIRLGAYVLATIALCAQAQTLTTNWVTARADYRIVRGQLYNIYRSQKWEEVSGECTRPGTNLACFRPHALKPDPLYRDASTTPGTIDPGIGQAIQVWEAEWALYHQIMDRGPFALTNARASMGQRINTRAMEIGSITVNGKPLPLYDCGTPNIVAVIRTNAPGLAGKVRP